MDLSTIIERQLGVATRPQLLASGVTEHQLRHRVQTERYRVMHRGIFLTVGGIPTLRQQAIGACLACGPGSVASHRTAAALWDLLDRTDIPIEVTIPGHRRRRVGGVVVHRSDTLTPSDRASLQRVPITSPARTLIDLASVLEADQIETACDEAFRRGVATPHRLLDQLERPDLTNAPGSALLRGIASDRCARGVPESVMERRAIRLLDEFRLPAPARQYTVRAFGRTVRFDLAYPDSRVAIELDGRAPHWGRQRWQSDHDRHNATELHGWVVLHFTWADVTERPVYVVCTVAAALGLRPRGWTRHGRPRKPSGASPDR